MAGNSIGSPVESIKLKRDFLVLKQQGRRKRLTSWLVVNYLNNSNENLRFGLTISKKVGNSVLRNRLKRFCREYMRKQQNIFLDINLIFYPKKDKNFYKELDYGDICNALSWLGAYSKNKQK